MRREDKLLIREAVSGKERRDHLLFVGNLPGHADRPDLEWRSPLQGVPELLALPGRNHEPEGRFFFVPDPERAPAHLVRVPLGVARRIADEPPGPELLDGQPPRHFGRAVDQDDLVFDVLPLIVGLPETRPHINQRRGRVRADAARTQRRRDILEVGELSRSGLDQPQLGHLGVPGRRRARRQVDDLALLDAVLLELSEDELGLEILPYIFRGEAVPIHPGQDDFVLQGHVSRGLVDDGPQQAERHDRLGTGGPDLGEDQSEGHGREAHDDKDFFHAGLLEASNCTTFFLLGCNGYFLIK